jgi:protein CpxP
MKMVRNKALAIAGAAVLAPALLFAAVAANQAQHKGDLGQRMAAHMAKKLGLSDDQTTQIQGIFANHKAEMSTQLDSVKAARTALFDAIHADTFDENAVRAASAKVAQAEADLAVSRARITSEVRNVLTPDQQAKAKEMLTNARNRAEKWGARMHSHLTAGLDGGN